MKFHLVCASVDDATLIVGRYPVIRKYKPKIDYPYQCKKARLVIEVNKDKILDFYKDIGKPIIIDESTDSVDNNMLLITIYDDWIE